MHHIEAHVARAAIAQHGIEISTVVVHQATAVVYQLRNLRDILLEDTESVGIGHHHGGDAVALFLDQLFQMF